MIYIFLDFYLLSLQRKWESLQSVHSLLPYKFYKAQHWKFCSKECFQTIVNDIVVICSRTKGNSSNGRNGDFIQTGASEILHRLTLQYWNFCWGFERFTRSSPDHKRATIWVGGRGKTAVCKSASCKTVSGCVCVFSVLVINCTNFTQ